MIELELWAADATGRYTTLATLRVDADRQVSFTGRRELFDTRAAAIDARTRRRVRFDDDPEVWARNPRHHLPLRRAGARGHSRRPSQPAPRARRPPRPAGARRRRRRCDAAEPDGRRRAAGRWAGRRLALREV